MFGKTSLASIFIDHLHKPTAMPLVYVNGQENYNKIDCLLESKNLY